MASHNLSTQETATRAGFSVSMLNTLRRGTPDRAGRSEHQEGIHPSIDVLVQLARALNLRLSWVLSWAGIEDGGDRFTQAEKRVLAELLGGEPADVDVLLRAHVKSRASQEELT